MIKNKGGPRPQKIMQIHVNREMLAEALALASGSTDKQGTMPILANVLITANSRGVEFVATDLEVSFRGIWEAEVVHEGTVCVKAAALSRVLDSIPKKSEVILTAMESHGLEIRQGETRYELYGDDPEKFPSVHPFKPVADMVILDAQVVREMIEKTRFSMGHDDLQYHLTGILWETIEVGDKPFLRLVSTDGHRLTAIDRPCDSRLDLGEGVFVPSKGIAEIYRLFKNCQLRKKEIKKTPQGFFGQTSVATNNPLKQSAVYASLDGKFITISMADNIQLTIRLPDTKFPDYRRIIPDPKLCQIALALDRHQFINALTKVSKISIDRFMGVVFTVDGKYMEISLTNPEIGRAVENIEVEWIKGKGRVAMGFNIPYLLQPLNHMRSEIVLIQATAADRPWQLTGADDPGYLAVVMPMDV